MEKIHGWHGALLRVDLESRISNKEPISSDLLLKFMGGRGLGVHFMSREVDSLADPLGPGNKLVIATGPMTGTPVPTAGRFSAISKSPLTGTIFDCNSGGSFGPRLKNCGIDALIIERQATEPVYIVVRPPGRVEIQACNDLWGKDVPSTTSALRAIYGNECRVACIGPAGENLVLISNIMNDVHHALGRGGLGAVMGSKHLKAIVVAPGDKASRIPTTVAKPDVLKIVIEEINKRINASPLTGKGLRMFGTAQLVNLMNAMGIFPVRNFQRGHDPRADSISGEKIIETIFENKTACYMCPIACGRMTRTSTRKGKGPEYESVWALGADCDVFDLEKITDANYECNALGIDTISAGATIACAMELNEKGKLSGAWNDVTFGNADCLIDLVQKIARKDGIGAELGTGSRKLAQKFGAPELAMQVKGLEMPAYDPRGAFGMALAYATSNRGACHLRAYTIGAEMLGLPKLFDRFSFSDKPDLVVKLQNSNAFYDSIVACKFTGMGVPDDYYSRAVSAIVGHDITVTDAELIGERIYTLERWFNVKAGILGKDDRLPSRFSGPLDAGNSKGKVPPLDIMLAMYYAVRGWSSDGVPLDKTLGKLGLLQE